MTELQTARRFAWTEIVALAGALIVLGIAFNLPARPTPLPLLVGSVVALAALLAGIMRPAWKPNTRLVMLIGGLVALVYHVLAFAITRNAGAFSGVLLGTGFWGSLGGALLLIIQGIGLPQRPQAAGKPRTAALPIAPVNIGQNMSIAFDALLANKFRSFLTMLGIIIGVMAVVALLSIGQGAQDMITDRISAAGTNTVSVAPTAAAETLTVDDAWAIEDQIDGLEYVSPQYSLASQTVFEGEVLGSRTTAVYPLYLEANQLSMDSGRFFDDQEEAGAARVAVLGFSAAEDLFGGINPVGRSIRINNYRFDVIGVMAQRDAGFGGNDPNMNVYVPFSTAARSLFDERSLTGDVRVTAISLTVGDANRIDEVKADVEMLLRDRHRLRPDDDLDFRVTDQRQLLEIANEITNTLTVMLTAIAAVSLLVGGIGIMNISLVSVTERTREIGLRKAVGARRLQILIQFMIETVVLAFMGGVFGVLAGIGAALLVNASGVFTASVNLDSIALGLGFSILVGLFFGVYPATRAASLQPIEALRYE